VHEAGIGRPRTFDLDEALEQAMLVFWERGYDGASLEELTGAMGIARTSMYRAFGDKQELFRKALQRYTERHAAYVVAALEQPTASEVAKAFLAGSVESCTTPGRPAGCLGVQGALAAGDTGRPARHALAAWRETGVAHLQHRFARAVYEGDLPAGTDAGILARYLMTVANGIAVQAAGGTARDELRTVAQLALQSWPSSTPSS
jgi:AcrR family transcriptional regulator